MKVDRMIGMMVSWVMLGVAWAHAGEPELTLNPRLDDTGKAIAESSEHPRRLGESLVLHVAGKLGEAIAKDARDNPATARKNVKLFLADVAMTPLLPGFKAVPGKENEVDVIFTLERESDDSASRKAWDEVLQHHTGLTKQLSVGLSQNGGIQYAADQPIYFQICSPGAAVGVISLFSILFWVAFIWIVRGPMCREGGSRSCPYSLGRTQMAYWGLLVLVCFTAVWLLCRCMEHIPDQVLTLLGISGATGLSAVVIGGANAQNARNRLQDLQKTLAELDAKRNAPLPTITPAETVQFENVTKEAATLSNAIAASHSTEGFWIDLLSDPDGSISFHRLQLIGWTVVLGIIFSVNVILTLSMPEFSSTLLVLMGISNGTYLGFKIPEKLADKQKDQTPAH